MTRPAGGVALAGLFLLAQAVMRPPIALIGFFAVSGDFLFVAVAAYALVDASRRDRPPRDPANGWIAAYFVTLALAALSAPDLAVALAKLATQAYLVAITLVLPALLRTRADLHFALKAWLAGSALVMAAAIVGLAAFVVAPDGALYRSLAFYHGSLPAGHYPRLSLTFLNGNMAANYLTVSFVIALLAGKVGAIGHRLSRATAAGCALALLTTLSPGLGGLALAAGTWWWVEWRGDRPKAARIALAAGIGGALLMVIAAAVTAIPYPGAAFVIELPGGLPLAASIRMTIWHEALANALRHPLGIGLGQPPVDVRFASPSGNLQTLSDAHNAFLSIAVQCGIVGLAAFVGLLAQIARRSLAHAGPSRLWLGFAFLNGMAYQGLTGSFEDSRHLWAVLGLWLAAGRSEPVSRR